MSAQFLVERTANIQAVPPVVFGLIDDLREWPKWSPWEDLDPAMTHVYSGPATGVGASHSWEGNKKAGSGSMTITASHPDERVTLDVVFLKPFKAENVTTFLIAPHADGSQVTWQMTGSKNLFFRIFGFLVSMDKLVGKDFDKGLARLKAVAERPT